MIGSTVGNYQFQIAIKLLLASILAPVKSQPHSLQIHWIFYDLIVIQNSILVGVYGKSKGNRDLIAEQL